MNSSTLPLKFELQANAIAAGAYPHTRYSLICELDSDCVSIEFKGFFTEQFDPNNRPYQNPTDEYYRNSKADFSLMYFLARGYLILSGWWRGYTIVQISNFGFRRMGMKSTSPILMVIALNLWHYRFTHYCRSISTKQS